MMPTRPHGRFGRTRRRTPLLTWSFLRPAARAEWDHEEFLENLRTQPRLRREFRSSLVFQLCVIGALGLSCAVLCIQSLWLLRHWRGPSEFGVVVWLFPAVIAALGLVALRRFLYVLSDFRRLNAGGKRGDGETPDGETSRDGEKR